jgi:hypothetical protein
MQQPSLSDARRALHNQRRSPAVTHEIQECGDGGEFRIAPNHRRHEADQHSPAILLRGDAVERTGLDLREQRVGLSGRSNPEFALQRVDAHAVLAHGTVAGPLKGEDLHQPAVRILARRLDGEYAAEGVGSRRQISVIEQAGT